MPISPREFRRRCARRIHQRHAMLPGDPGWRGPYLGLITFREGDRQTGGVSSPAGPRKYRNLLAYCCKNIQAGRNALHTGEAGDPRSPAVSGSSQYFLHTAVTQHTGIQRQILFETRPIAATPMVLGLKISAASDRISSLVTASICRITLSVKRDPGNRSRFWPSGSCGLSVLSC